MIDQYISHGTAHHILDAGCCFDTVFCSPAVRAQSTEALSELLAIGHNPALTDFCNRISTLSIENIPTCGYVQLTITCPWHGLSEGCAEVSHFLRPKVLRK